MADQDGRPTGLLAWILGLTLVAVCWGAAISVFYKVSKPAPAAHLRNFPAVDASQMGVGTAGVVATSPYPNTITFRDCKGGIVPIYADKERTIPLPNPVSTGPGGKIFMSQGCFEISFGE